VSKIGDWLRRGLLAPLKLVLPKNPWLRVLVYALPIVLLLALFAPALDVVVKLVELVFRLIEPLLETTIGRVLLLVVVLTLTGFFLAWLLRRRVRDMRAEAVLGRHLRAVGALVSADARRSREHFKKVVRYKGPLPDRYPHVVQDAAVKLARQCLADGRVDEAQGWLSRVVEPGLPPELMRSLVQLRLEALRRQHGVLPATLRREAEAAVERFPKDVVLLAALRDLLLDDGDLEAAAAVQQRVVKETPAGNRISEQQRLVDLLARHGQKALEAGDLDAARKIARRLQQADQDGPAGELLLGDVHRAAGEYRQAVRAYGATRSPLGLDRIAELLHEHPGAVEPRELLTSCPLQGTLLLVARELARSGQRDKAERAARFAAESLGPTPTVCAVLAEVLDLLGQEQRAQLLREQAITRLLAPPGRALGESREAHDGAGGGT
jgi:tetratricopeptide (TPR) repeat protein